MASHQAACCVTQLDLDALVLGLKPLKRRDSGVRFIGLQHRSRYFAAPLCVRLGSLLAPADDWPTVCREGAIRGGDASHYWTVDLLCGDPDVVRALEALEDRVLGMLAAKGSAWWPEGIDEAVLRRMLRSVLRPQQVAGVTLPAVSVNINPWGDRRTKIWVTGEDGGTRAAAVTDVRAGDAALPVLRVNGILCHARDLRLQVEVVELFVRPRRRAECEAR